MSQTLALAVTFTEAEEEDDKETEILSYFACRFFVFPLLVVFRHVETKSWFHFFHAGSCHYFNCPVEEK